MIKIFILKILHLKNQGLSTRQFLNIPKTFPQYAPNSAGRHNTISKLTINTANSIMQKIYELGIMKSTPVEVITSESFGELIEYQSEPEVHRLAKLFNKHQSDKAKNHSYQDIYAPILASVGKIGRLLEIGLGSNNSKVVSNMGIRGKPGASVRAFKEFLPNWQIYGADIDKSILINEDRIQTYYVNQLEEESLKELLRFLPTNLDVIIDDGLHSPDANINVIKFAHSILAKDGWLVIEDINVASLPIWQITSLLIQKNFRSYIVNDKGTLLFICQKLF